MSNSWTTLNYKYAQLGDCGCTDKNIGHFACISGVWHGYNQFGAFEGYQYNHLERVIVNPPISELPADLETAIPVMQGWSTINRYTAEETKSDPLFYTALPGDTIFYTHTKNTSDAIVKVMYTENYETKYIDIHLRTTLSEEFHLSELETAQRNALSNLVPWDDDIIFQPGMWVLSWWRWTGENSIELNPAPFPGEPWENNPQFMFDANCNGAFYLGFRKWGPGFYGTQHMWGYRRTAHTPVRHRLGGNPLGGLWAGCVPETTPAIGIPMTSYFRIAPKTTILPPTNEQMAEWGAQPGQYGWTAGSVCEVIQKS